MERDKRPHILVVEDEAHIARMLQVLLERQGYGVRIAYTGKEALKALEAHPVELVLLDIMLPGLDGLEVCRTIKEDGRLRHIPVMMVTAKDSLDEKISGLELGADDYLTKPFSNEELLARLKALLRAKRVDEEIIQLNRELSALNAVVSAVNQSLDQREILEIALEGVLQVMEAEAGWVGLFQEDGGFLVQAYRHLPQSFIEEVESRIKPNGVDPSKNLRTLAGKEGLRDVLVTSLMAKDIPLGSLGIGRRQPLPFVPMDRELLVSIGRQVGMALEKARLYGESQKRAKEFHALYEVGKAMASSFDLQDVLPQITSSIAGVINAIATSLMLWDPITKRLRVVSSHNLSPEYIRKAEEIRSQVEKSPSLLSLEEKRPVAISDIYQDSLFAPWREAARMVGYSSFITVPLVLHERAIGVLNVYLSSIHHFSPDEVELLSHFANQAAIAIENALLFEEKTRLAITDELTGLYNHRYFYQVLEGEIKRAQRYKRPLSLIMADIDYFKNYNDHWGHLKGDEALRQLARVLRRNARDVDVLARYGGEEFAFILPETELSQAGIQAERIRVEVEKHPFDAEEVQPGGKLTISLGVAAYTLNMERMEELVHAADQALYRAKAQGRNRVSLAGEGKPPAFNNQI